ncbi:MAG: hypothetical protein KGZ56_10850 [Dethiobacter sp.]|nr:hypothetical protein [Dethiobacter sp.]MBS3899872.1 hypothetical protein [Dethiobacter sp.]
MARREGDTFFPLARQLVTTRLGAGLISTKLLSSEGKERTLDAIRRFMATADSLSTEKIIIVGTSAMREAQDGAIFAEQIQNQFGVIVNILPCETEAIYSYTGATLSLSSMTGAVVFDLGGGSCEVIWSQAGQLVLCSRKIGAVYLSERFFDHDPPQAVEVEAAKLFIRQQLAGCCLPSRPLVGVGGTVTSLAAMAMEMREYVAERVHGYSLSRLTVRSLLAAMLSLPCSERGRLPGIQKERAAILPAGTLVVEMLLAISGESSLLVSEGDILLGSLYHLSGEA